MNNSEMTFEEAISKLESIVKELENGCPLDDAIDKYSEGMNLVNFCSKKLKNATEKVNKILTESGSLEDFEVKEAD